MALKSNLVISISVLGVTINDWYYNDTQYSYLNVKR